MITKKYKISAFFEFLYIRQKVWNIQFTALVIAGCIGFFSSVLCKIRDKLEYEKEHANTYYGFPDTPEGLDLAIDKIDTSIYYLFVMGIFKDRRKEVQNYFYFPMFALAVALLIEKNSIDWLTDRNGCTYKKLQKCCEIDMRERAIKENWPNNRPVYDP